MAGIVLVARWPCVALKSAKDDFRFDAAKLKDRTAWIQVNAEPYQMPAPSLLFALLALGCKEKLTRTLQSYITVYVNKIGRDAMFAKETQRFPEGSVIVKEKFSSQARS